MKIAKWLVTGIAITATGFGVALAATPTTAPIMTPVCWCIPASAPVSGAYVSITGQCASGEDSTEVQPVESSSAAAVSSAPAVVASVPGAAAVAVAVVKPSETAHPATTALPVTGRNLAGMLTGGFLLLGVGVIAIVATRRRKVIYRSE